MGIKTLVFHINPSIDFELVWLELENAGCILLYSDVCENTSQIYGNIPANSHKEQFLTFPEILAIEEVELPDIDWEAQWAAHEDYSEGFLQVDLNLYCQASPVIKMIPGPGFGDHSHPTTRLILRLMPSLVLNQEVIDVGCGSGILSLAANFMGAHSVCGIDIEEAALIHARANAECNGIMIPFIFAQSLTSANKGTVILMNMIQSEQEIAWKSLSVISGKVTLALTSGILCEGREDYLKLCKKWGWYLLDELEEDGWLGFVFKVKC